MSWYFFYATHHVVHMYSSFRVSHPFPQPGKAARILQIKKLLKLKMLLKGCSVIIESESATVFDCWYGNLSKVTWADKCISLVSNWHSVQNEILDDCNIDENRSGQQLIR